MKRMAVLYILMMFFGIATAQPVVSSNSGTTLEKLHWGRSGDKDIFLFTLTNKQGMSLQVTNYGGTIISIIAPDRDGNFDNLVLGFDSLQQYLNRNPYFGSLVGRFANRISGGRFAIDSTEYVLSTVFGGVHIHGGMNGFSRQVFHIVDAYASGDSAIVTFSYLSPDNEEGYPGNLNLTVSYVLNNDNEIRIWYTAETDQSTVINLTNHSYFNLTGCKENVLNHETVIHADSITEADERLIPTGRIKPVAGTAYDFTTAHKIGARIREIPGGYDNNYVLRKTNGDLSLVAEVFDPESGRFLQAYTTEPGMQFFTCNSFNGTITGRGGIPYDQYYAFCLEMQHFPDSPNRPEFPSTILRPGETYRQLTIYKFGIR